MSEEKQVMLAKRIDSQNQFRRTQTDSWILAGILLGCVCGTVFLFLIVSLETFPPTFPIFMFAGWIAAGMLWWWYMFRRTLWEVRQQIKKKPEDSHAAKIRRMIGGIGLIVIGVLMPMGLSNFHFWWLPLIYGPMGTGLAITGIALIVQIIKSESRTK